MVGSEWKYRIRVERHVYPRTVVSVTYLYKIPTKRVGPVQSGHQHYLIECKLLSPRYSWQIVHLALINNHPLTQLNLELFSQGGIFFHFALYWNLLLFIWKTYRRRQSIHFYNVRLSFLNWTRPHAKTINWF